MANINSQVSRLEDKSTNRDDELASTAVILGRRALDFSEPVAAPAAARARVISVVNQKGGVGKTTTTINLGAALAELGRRVLLIDFDSQASMTTGLGIKPSQIKEQYGSIWYLLNDSTANVTDFILKSNVPGLDFIRGHGDLAAAEAAFVTEIAKEHKLRKILAPVLELYDDILIDCSPSLGTLTVNALTASDGVLIPMECEYFAVLGLSLVKETIGKIQEHTNPHLRIDGGDPVLAPGRSLSGTYLNVFLRAFAYKFASISAPDGTGFSRTLARAMPEDPHGTTISEGVGWRVA